MTWGGYSLSDDDFALVIWLSTIAAELGCSKVVHDEKIFEEGARVPIREAEDAGIRSVTGIHLYHFFLYNCAQRVALVLAEKDLAFTPHSVNLLSRENAKDEYLRINPAGLVPALVHDGVIITESIDILRYLEERFPEPSLYPSESAARREVNAWMDEATNHHNGVIKTYMYAVALGGKKSLEEMRSYLERQKRGPGAAEFH